MTPGRLRVVVATPLSEELCALLVEREPRIDLVIDRELVPGALYPGDHSGDPNFRRTPAQQEAFDALLDSAEALYGVPDQSATALRRTVESNPALRWVHTTPAGGGGQVRAAQLRAADLERVLFSTSAGVHADPLAEFAVLGVFAGAKSLPRLHQLQARAEWSDRWAMGSVSGSTVLVVGLGSIGRRTAEKLAALGARVIGVHRRGVEAHGVERIVPVDAFAEAAATADAIVLCLPGTETTRGMLSSEVLAAVKPGVTIVNVGRGTTVDEPALIAALQDGRVGFAALDVFFEEPLAAESPLWGMPNVLVSPHTAALTDGEDRLIAELFARNSTRLLDGQPLLNRVDTVEFY